MSKSTHFAQESVFFIDIESKILFNLAPSIAQIAQSVEQRTENPCVGGSIPPLGTNVSVQDWLLWYSISTQNYLRQASSIN